METLDPHNDLIDQYLRDELKGEALADFIKLLEEDEALRKEVELRKQLVSAIQLHGAAQLKNFIRSRTTQKKAMRIAFRTWYYAAAAVGLILVASVVLLLNQKSESIMNPVAKEEVATPSETEKTTDNNVNQQPTYEKEQPRDVRADHLAINDPRPSMIEDDAGAESDPDNSNPPAVVPDIITIASNIPVIPIKIEPIVTSQEDLAITKTSVEAKKPSQPKNNISLADNTAKNMDSAMFRAAKQEAELEKMAVQSSKFRLNFYNTRDAQPQISLTKAGNAEASNIAVYNLPYDNPLIFEYKNRFFLKAGDLYYEFNINKTGKQAVEPVKDSELLAALNH